LLREQGHFMGTARVPGRLYDLGQYPGARPANDFVVGEVFQIDESLLAAMDKYEGAEYERAIVSANLDDGRAIDCWIYWYVGGAPGRLIASGDWTRR